jgi:putative flippase GtrA
VVDVAVFNFLFFIIGDTKSLLFFIVIKGVAFIAAVTNSYIWNSKWTFKENKFVAGTNKLTQFTKFLGINTAALLVNVSVASAVFLIVQDIVQNHLIATNISAIAGSVSGMLINLKGYKRLFTKK